MAYKQSNNPISRKTSPLHDKGNHPHNADGTHKSPTISEDELDLKSESTSVHKPSEYNPPLSGYGQQGDVEYEHISDMEEIGADQPDYEAKKKKKKKEIIPTGPR